MLEKLPLKVVHEVTQGQYAVLEALLPVTFRVDLMRKRLERIERLVQHKIKKKNKEYQERRDKEKKGSKSKIINAGSGRARREQRTGDATTLTEEERFEILANELLGTAEKALTAQTLRFPC